MTESESNGAPGPETHKYWKSLTLKIARETLRTGGRSGNTSSSIGTSDQQHITEDDINMRTTSVNTDENSSEERVTRTSNFQNEE